MTYRTPAEVRAFFEEGDVPQESQFSDFIDSVHLETFNVRLFGAEGDGTTDDSVAIQAAIDAAFGAGAPDLGRRVFFPTGNYRITQALTWRDCNLVGDFENMAVRLTWDGAAGATVLTKPTATEGGSSHGIMSGIAFFAGTNEPATWVDLTANLVDKHFYLDKVHFKDCTGDAIKVQRWINIHWRNLRFDNIGGYAIRLSPDGTPTNQNLSSFMLSGFTYDHRRSSGPASGMILVDNSSDNVSNIGVLELANARIEINTAWTGDQAVVHYTTVNSSPNPRALGLILRNITYQDSASMASDCLLFRDTTDTVNRDSLILENVRTEGISAVLAGTWPSNQYFPSAGNISFLAMNMNSSNSLIELSSGVRAQIANGATTLFGARAGNSSEESWQVNGNGTMFFGSGSASPDTFIDRSAAGVINLAGSGGQVSGNIQYGPSATTAQLADISSAINTIAKWAGKMVWNTTTGLPVFATGSTAGSVWNDATGATAHTPV